ncbi:HNH endonuclease [Salmonella enterica subsp. enterica serovar Nagoya]|nr:HNH endonuclease [Salmonella enterica subsp. enterica serovar Nagoya]ECP0317541.1 HNH endonuclease [Salmonella enterica subsp. enterica]
MFPVTKSTIVPESLDSERSYREKDVIEALSHDFYNKCYICEVKDPLVLNVEHFIPHEGDNAKKFDWKNLFFACGRCNNIKRNQFENILDCTDPQVDILRAIRHVFPTTAYAEHVSIIPMNDDVKTIETAKLISKVFNDDNTGNKDLTRVFLKRRLMKQYRKFLTLIFDYDDDDILPEDKDLIARKIKNMLRDEYEFSAFLRWTVLDAPQLHHFKDGVF